MKVFVTTQFEGVHRWKDAPNQVKFLRDYHRHMFNVLLEIEVFDEDRDIEFVLLKKQLNAFIKEDFENSYLDYSCETMAKRILLYMLNIYKNRAMLCSVSEDGENGAIVELTKDGEIL